MNGYRHKDVAGMAYDRNKKRLRNEARLVLDELLNEAMAEMTAQFNAALLTGNVLELEGTREEMLAYLRTAAVKRLELTAVSS